MIVVVEEEGYVERRVGMGRGGGRDQGSRKTWKSPGKSGNGRCGA